MEARLSLITLGVADLARAVAFYERGLGWKRSSAGDDEVAFFQAGGVVLALWPRTLLAADAGLPSLPTDGTRFGGIALAQNVRSREEVDAVLAEAVAAGGRLLKSGHEAVWGGYTGYFADPDGYPWEVAWNPGFPLAPDGTVQLPP